MVGGGGAVAGAAKMALNLAGQHYWAVSGTPFKRNTDDIRGLLRFLQMSPVSDKRLFHAAFGEPFTSQDPLARERLVNLLKIVMWRTAKRDAKLGLADPLQIIRAIDFDSPVERFHYDSMHAAMQANSGGLNAMNATVVKGTNNELIRLRHACDHFQLGNQGLALGASKKRMQRGKDEDLEDEDGFIVPDDGKQRRVVTKEEVYTLNDLKQSLMERERNQYIDHVKSWVSVKLHLAGLLMLKGAFEEAAQLYSSVLVFADQDKDGRASQKQIVHAAFNLIDAVGKMKTKSAQSKFVLAPVRQKLNDLETRFLRDSRTGLQSAFDMFDTMRQHKL